MAGIEVKAVNLLGMPVPYAYAVKAGKWIFLTGHEAFDFESGMPEAVAGPPGFPRFGRSRSRREGDFILQRMQRILREFGSDLSHAVRLDQYYPNPEAVAAYHLARHAAFGDYIPPSTSVLMERLFKADSHICMSMIAVVPGKDYEIGKLYPKEVPVPVGSFFVPAITCNDFVFVAGQMASDENALDPSVKLPKEVRNWGGPNAIRRQTEFVIRKRLEPALKAAGSTWKDILKAQIYVPSAADIPDALDVWHQHVGAHPCALTAVPTHGFGFIDGVVEINLLALRDGAKRKKEVLKVDLPAMSSYGAVVRAGELVFCPGLMPVGFPSPDPFDGLAHSAQAHAMLGCADKICRAAGTSLSNIVRAQWFMSDVTQFPGVAMAWMGRQGKQPHPFVAVQVPGELPAPGAALTADFWIYAP